MHTVCEPDALVAVTPNGDYVVEGKLQKAVVVLRQECRQYVKGVDELHAAAGGRTTTICKFADNSVAYLAPDAPDSAEAGELKDEVFAAAQRILDEQGY